jgi:Rps23 Pro-64 3,4-dihydroxylase Tpa1-like proline 4-hydroxylase
MLGAWAKDVSALAKEFESGEPFPLLLIDGFLEESFAEELLSEFPSIDAMNRTKDYVFGDKREEADFAKAGPISQAYYDYLLSDDFAEIVSTVTGRTLFMDPSFHGGGFHQGGNGSHLDTHVDFNIHPKHKDWLRVLNVLLYMNKDWKPELDGALLLRTDPKNEPRAILPLYNRGVFMFTGDNTYHGYRKMSLPDGVTRKSIAGYAYELIDEGSLKARTTSWAPEDGGVLKKSLAKHWTSLSAAKNKITGSNG